MLTRSLAAMALALSFSTTAYASVGSSGDHAVRSAQDLQSQNRPRPTLRIQTRIGDGPWSGRKAIYPLKGEDVSMRVREVQGGEPRWYMIFADLTRNYANANPPWTEDPYKWTGIEAIQYYRIELVEQRGRFEIHPFTDGVEPWKTVTAWFEDQGRGGRTLSFYRPEAGTFWFQAEVIVGENTLRSHGMEDPGPNGIHPRVTRISIRDGDGLKGHIASFYNVPGVFGSVLNQSVNHVGADCADVLMAAWSRWKKRKLSRNHNVQMMVTRFKKRAEFEMKGGAPPSPLAWGKDVQEGDFIAVRYGEGGKKYHHVGALWEDANGNDELDGEDLVIHAGPDPLHLSRLKHGAFDGHVVILKP